MRAFKAVQNRAVIHKQGKKLKKDEDENNKGRNEQYRFLA